METGQQMDRLINTALAADQSSNTSSDTSSDMSSDTSSDTSSKAGDNSEKE